MQARTNRIMNEADKPAPSRLNVRLADSIADLEYLRPLSVRWGGTTGRRSRGT